MAHPSAAWGIEIGQFAIKAIRLERDGDSARVTDFSVIPHRKVLSTPDIDIAEVTRLSLGQFISEKNLEGEQLVISVPGHLAFARFAKLPPVEPKALPDIVKFEAVQQIPFPIEDVEWDYEEFREDDAPELEVGIFAITRERVNEKLDVYGEVGLSPETLTLSPVALFNSMHFDMQLKGSTSPLVFIDIGTQATDVIIANGDRCWIRTFPLGGTHFTEAIAKAFKISYAKAERLKIESASSKYAKQIMQAMRPVFSDLLQELQRSMSYAVSMGELTEMIGIGSTFKIPGLRKFIGQQLQVNVTRLDEFKRIDVGGREAASFAENCVNMATAYGLALQGIGHGQININLVPTAILREQMWHNKTKWFVAAACIIVLGSALSILGPFLQEKKLDRSDVGYQRARSVEGDADKLVTSFRNAEKEGKIGSEAAQLINLFDYRDVWPYVVNDSAEALASAGPANRTMTLADFLKAYPDAKQRPIVQLHELSGELIPQTSPNKIAVKLEVQLSHADPVNYLTSTVAKWLTDNENPEGDRAGVPYRIVANSISCNPSILETLTGSEFNETLTSSGGSQSGQNQGGGLRGGSGGGSRGGGLRGGSGGGSRGGGLRGGSGGGSRGGGLRGGSGGGSRGDGQQGGGTPRTPNTPAEGATVPFKQVTDETLDELAPLPQHTDPQLHPEGVEWYRATITFEVEIFPQPHVGEKNADNGGRQ
jgi:type IV pilus assembly protein PilM